MWALLVWNLIISKPVVQIYWLVVALMVQSDVWSPIHRQLLSSSGVMLSWHLLFIAETDRNSSLSSTFVIIYYMEKIFLNFVDISSEATGSYALSWPTTSIISIDSNPEDTKINSTLRRNGSQGIQELVSNRQQWWTYSFVGQRMGI